MRRYLPLFLALVFISAGCALHWGHAPCPPPFAIYHAPSFDANSLQRVLLLPLANESAFPCAADEIRDALAAELQCVGPFEVVIAPPTPEACQARLVHLRGRFDEAAMAHLARTFKADAIVVGAVTHYHPYPPPNLGLNVQMVSPTSAVVIASVDGLWDGRDIHLAKEARVYYRKSSHPLLRPGQDSDVALASPKLFQRFVCNQVAHALVEPPPESPTTAAVPGSPSGAPEPAHSSAPHLVEPPPRNATTPSTPASPSVAPEPVHSSAPPADNKP